MRRSLALPFLLKRASDVYTGGSVTTTRETVHGLLRLGEHHLTIQWRVGRRTDHIGSEMRTDEEVEPVREITVPLARLSGATLQRRLLGRLVPPRLILTAADLAAFEGLAGAEGLGLAHPAELVLTLRRGDRLPAEEFSAELALALAHLELPPSERRDPLQTPEQHRRLGDGDSG
jgi:hypothetical protein